MGDNGTLVKKSSESSQNVPKCLKMSQNVPNRRIVVRTVLFDYLKVFDVQKTKVSTTLGSVGLKLYCTVLLLRQLVK